MQKHIDTTRESYNQLAETYTARIADELAHKPFDRQLLDRFAEEAVRVGPLCDMGCGPGHVAYYLHTRGVEVSGIDLSPEMIEQARKRYPDIPFHQGNMASLDVPDATWGGIVAFYSIIHIPREHVIDVLREFRRVLRPGGILLLAFHQGDEIRHFDELWEQPVSLDFIFFQRVEIEAYLQKAGFSIVESIERPPYPDIEAQTRRVYTFARKAI